jgi:hypothetical protein
MSVGTRRRLATVFLFALVLSGCDDGPSSSPGGVAAASTVDRPFRCPGPREDPVDVVDHAGDMLPTGARAVLLCRLDNHIPWTPPHGVLTAGLDQVVRDVNAQKVHDPNAAVGCGGVGAPAWSMVFRYADGTRTITGDNGGCWDLLVGSTERFGSKKVFEAYLRALVRQRAHEHPRPFHRTPPACPARIDLGYFAPVADPTTGRIATLCVLQPQSTHTARRLPLTGAQLAVLRKDFATAPQRRTDADAMSNCPADPGPALDIRGLDAWQEPFQVYVECGAYRILRPAAARYSFATLLPRTQRLLDRLSHS